MFDPPRVVLRGEELGGLRAARRAALDALEAVIRLARYSALRLHVALANCIERISAPWLVLLGRSPAANASHNA